jgi:hypothetical protein
VAENATIVASVFNSESTPKLEARRVLVVVRSTYGVGRSSKARMRIVLLLSEVEVGTFHHAGGTPPENAAYLNAA